MFDARVLGKTAGRMCGLDGVMIGMFTDFERLPPSPFLPLVGSSDSRRLLDLSSPVSTGEYPALLTDIDDLP
ncbi:hypothetical protein ABT095_26430 [Kitasatospora sp. NPDC002227]|uniref:hypothetical protein n=1 Tax=Kitasatospora sp. NPDC002227 TaxID=3154773 RepID=UPI00332A05CE